MLWRQGYIFLRITGTGGKGLDALIKQISREKERSLLILVAQKFTYFVLILRIKPKENKIIIENYC